MPLTHVDWFIIAGYLVINLLIGFYYRRRATGNTEDFFISGRDVSWWLAGTSMVATTFAADTPLLVSGIVATQGIAGNWIWWSMCLSGMLTVFFFARYWRRAEILTDVELTEIRYSGKPAAFLRGFKALYLGLLMNCLILGWVTNAMADIITVLLGPMIAAGRVLPAFFVFLAALAVLFLAALAAFAVLALAGFVAPALGAVLAAFGASSSPSAAGATIFSLFGRGPIEGLALSVRISVMRSTVISSR